tara:strand:+ start:33668 stop:33895 length:228 start_codon:yes stop_codon:yes gene_type:complete
MPKKEKKELVYKDDKGNSLYGFSQINLDRTNAKINGLILGIKVLIFLFIILLVALGTFSVWLAQNDVVTRLIYNY